MRFIGEERRFAFLSELCVCPTGMREQDIKHSSDEIRA